MQAAVNPYGVISPLQKHCKVSGLHSFEGERKTSFPFPFLFYYFVVDKKFDFLGRFAIIIHR